jgi:hypothetical protein
LPHFPPAVKVIAPGAPAHRTVRSREQMLEREEVRGGVGGEDVAQVVADRQPLKGSREERFKPTKVERHVPSGVWFGSVSTAEYHTMHGTVSRPSE